MSTTALLTVNVWFSGENTASVSEEFDSLGQAVEFYCKYTTGEYQDAHPVLFLGEERVAPAPVNRAAVRKAFDAQERAEAAGLIESEEFPRYLDEQVEAVNALTVWERIALSLLEGRRLHEKVGSNTPRRESRSWILDFLNMD